MLTTQARHCKLPPLALCWLLPLSFLSFSQCWLVLCARAADVLSDSHVQSSTLDVLKAKLLHVVAELATNLRCQLLPLSRQILYCADVLGRFVDVLLNSFQKYAHFHQSQNVSVHKNHVATPLQTVHIFLCLHFKKVECKPGEGDY